MFAIILVCSGLLGFVIGLDVWQSVVVVLFCCCVWLTRGYIRDSC